MTAEDQDEDSKGTGVKLACVKKLYIAKQLSRDFMEDNSPK